MQTLTYGSLDGGQYSAVVDTSARGRRIAWHGGRTERHLPPRERIVAAASRCLVELGLERTSISAIAREAGISRQTVYSYFPTKDEIVSEALLAAASAASERIIAEAAGAPTAADFVVEICIAAVAEFRRNPAIAPIMTLLGEPQARRDVLTPETIAATRRFLEPLLDYQPELASRMDELTETYLRFELSLLTLDSSVSTDPTALRGYLHRALVPALGIRAAEAGDDR
jgi:AcrR family transcriptional regulator